MILGIGVDVVEVSRIRRELDLRGDMLLDEVLTPEEIEYCKGRARPFPSVAARFAAKEALFKALGSGKRGAMSWRDLEIRRDRLGKPELAATGATGEAVRALGTVRIHLSLTHTEGHAMALVLLEGETGG